MSDSFITTFANDAVFSPSFQRHLRVCVTSSAYGGAGRFHSTVLLFGDLQSSGHHHLGAQPKHVATANKQVSTNALALVVMTHFYLSFKRKTQHKRMLSSFNRILLCFQNYGFAQRSSSDTQCPD